MSTERFPHKGAISQLYYKLKKLSKEVEKTVLVFHEREQPKGHPLPTILHPLSLVCIYL